jgi:hypothetical protein
MEKEFIPYEQALALKELGFSDKCIASYIYNADKLLWGLTAYPSKNDYTHIISSPLYQQAFRWFREKYEAYYTIEGSKKHGFAFCIYSENDDIIEEISLVYNTYEQAELECLKKLIEIVKKQIIL